MTAKILYFIVMVLGLCFAGVYPVSSVYAQESPDVVQNQKKDNTAHPALRMFSEFGMGTVMGTAVGGTALLAGLFADTFLVNGCFSLPSLSGQALTTI